MKYRTLLLFFLLAFGVLNLVATAQDYTIDDACNSEHTPIPPGYPVNGCAPGVTALTTFSATPLVDGCQTVNGQLQCETYGSGANQQTVSLYGTYGNDENAAGGLAAAHYQQGINVSQTVQPLCSDGSTSSPCSDGYPKAIVVLFLGLSNCTIEVCGGNSDAFEGVGNPLTGQPCATGCPNLTNGGGPSPWNVTRNGDTTIQYSFLRQVYEPNPHLVGTSVAIIDGAKGQRTLDHWDPTSFGFWAHRSDCDDDSFNGVNPECEYVRVSIILANHHYSERQVQVVFLRSADAMPQCDLRGLYCNTSITTIPDAYKQEQYLGDILRYLKCCKTNSDGQIGIPRYPNLKQVFLTSQTYDGYANQHAACLLPEPYAYEGGFAVQRTILAQINQAADQHGSVGTGSLNYTLDANGNNIGDAPWFDWGPYLWINGETPRQKDNQIWCGGDNDFACHGSSDVRNGGGTDYPGDYTHPRENGLKKVADQLVTFFTQDVPYGSPFVQWWKGL